MSYAITEPINRKSLDSPRNRVTANNHTIQRRTTKSARSKKNATITIPKNGRRNEVRTARANSSREVSSQFRPNTTKQNDFAVSITQQVHIIEEFSSLINKCSIFMDYPIIHVVSEISPHPPNSLALKKKEILNSIYEMMSDQSFMMSLPANVFNDLFEMIKQHIFRKIPDLPDFNDYTYVSQNYIVKNWDHIEIIHNIMQYLIEDIDKIGPQLDDDFALKLVKQLESPVYEESISIEKELSFILQNYFGYRQNILRYILSPVISYLDGVSCYTLCMPPILRLFLDYFLSLPLPVNQNNFLLFRTVFYPLFTTNSAYIFEEPLHQISSFFQELEPATALWCLYYLKRHWPCTSTAKQMLFIHQFSRLLPTLPSTVMEKVGPTVLKILSKCICSQSYRVAIYMTSFASDDDFIDVYRPMPEAISDILLPAAKAACDHWNEEEKDLAIRLSDKLSNFHFRSKPQTRAMTATLASRSKKEIEKFGWNDIISIAASSDPSINADEFRAKLNEMDEKSLDNQSISS